MLYCERRRKRRWGERAREMEWRPREREREAKGVNQRCAPQEGVNVSIHSYCSPWLLAYWFTLHGCST
jgi:hypothetical protein